MFSARKNKDAISLLISCATIEPAEQCPNVFLFCLDLSSFINIYRCIVKVPWLSEMPADMFSCDKFHLGQSFRYYSIFLAHLSRRLTR